MYCRGIRTLLNVTNIKKDEILNHHITRLGEGLRMSNKELIRINIIIITSFKQKLKFVSE